MKPKEIRELTAAELAKQLGDSRRELLNLRVQASSGQLENSARLRLVRRDIARLLTISRQRQQKEAKTP